MRHICTYIALLILGLALSMHAQAQELLVDTLAEFSFIYDLNEVSQVYGTDTVHLDKGIDFSVVESIRRSQALYLKDYGPGNIANLTVRGGSAQQLAVFWNGIPINSPSLGITDLSLLPNAFFENALLSKGSSSLLSGAGGLTGGLYLYSAGAIESTSVRLDHRLTPHLGGSDTQFVLKTKGDKIMVRSALVFNSADNEFRYLDDSAAEPVYRSRENAASQGTGIANDVDFNLSSRSYLNLSFHYIDQDREIASPIGLPNREESQRDGIFRSSMTYRFVADQMVHQFTGGFIKERQEYSAPHIDLDSKIVTERYHLRYQNDMQLSNQILLSLRADHNYSSALVEMGAESNTNESGLFVGIEKQWSSRTAFKAGLRQEWRNASSNPFTASLGLEHRLGKDLPLTFRGTLSRNFRNPTLNDLYWPELGNPELVSEQGVSADATFIYSPEKATFSISVFHNSIDDQISWMPGADGYFRPLNVYRSMNNGLESEMVLSDILLDAIRLNYTYTRSEVQQGESNDWTASLYQPAHMVHLSTWEQIGRIEFGYTLSYNSEVLTDYSGTPRANLDEIFLMDLHAQWKPEKELSGFSLGCSVKNLTNKNFEYIRDRPVPGLYFQFQLNIRIDEKK